jgi:hypothetical protein
MRPELKTVAVRTLEMLLLLRVELPTSVMIDAHAISGLWRVIVTRK